MSSNIIVRQIVVTDLSQQLKREAGFLKWMARRYAAVNEEQSAAFTTGAELILQLRQDLVAGEFDLIEDDLFTDIGDEGAR